MYIKEVYARKIPDSRGEDTIEVVVNGCKASAPSGSRPVSGPLGIVPPLNTCFVVYNSNLGLFFRKIITVGKLP